jgi:hypothetical protein
LGSPSGDEADQYVNWWQGGRITLTTSRATIAKDIAADKKENQKSGFPGPVKNSPVIVCEACEPIAIYQATADTPANEPTQLTEYTLSGVDRSTSPIGIDPKEVTYNISYVDSAALPVAMEPWGNDFVGWIGGGGATNPFQQAMNAFRATPVYAGWPSYQTEADTPVIVRNKVPSTGVVFALESGANPPTTLTRPGRVFENMIANWDYCVATLANTGTVCATIREVDALFKANYANYAASWSGTWGCPGEPRSLTSVNAKNWYLSKVYGWVPFNETPAEGSCNSKIENEIARTPGYSEAAVVKIEGDYIGLQYTTSADGVVKGAAFNPYVQLIHGALPPNAFLGMKNAYAFSVDDGVGVQQLPGTGLVISVGGVLGMPNPNPFDKGAAVDVGPGFYGPQSPDQFVEYGICQDFGPDIEGGAFCPEMYPFRPGSSFNVASVRFNATKVVLLDAYNRKYEFIIASAPPFGSTNPNMPTNAMIKCVPGDPNIGWCMGVHGYTLPANTGPMPVPVPRNYISTPPPNKR